MRRWMAAFVLISCFGAQAGNRVMGMKPSRTTNVITTESLLCEMTDLRRLAELPVPAYTTKQFSSYDRRSKTPADAKGWFENHDRGQYLRVEERDGRKEFVMMDTDGPGAIVRIWSGRPIRRARCGFTSTVKNNPPSKPT